MSFQYGDFESEFEIIGKDGKPLYKLTSWTEQSARKAALFLDKKLTNDHKFACFEMVTADDDFGHRRIRLLTQVMDNNIDPKNVGAAAVSLTNITTKAKNHA